MSSFWGPFFHFFWVKIILYLYLLQLFSADAIVFSKKKIKNFLTPKKWKNGPQKLLIIGPDPFISQSSPDHSPQSRIDFSYYQILGPDICSLICALRARNGFAGCCLVFCTGGLRYWDNVSCRRHFCVLLSDWIWKGTNKRSLLGAECCTTLG